MVYISPPDAYVFLHQVQELTTHDDGRPLSPASRFASVALEMLLETGQYTVDDIARHTMIRRSTLIEWATRGPTIRLNDAIATAGPDNG